MNYIAKISTQKLHDRLHTVGVTIEKKFWLLQPIKTVGTYTSTIQNRCCTLRKGMWATFHNTDQRLTASTIAGPLPRLQFSRFVLGALLCVLVLSLNS